jgi:hypothetical protein
MNPLSLMTGGVQSNAVVVLVVYPLIAEVKAVAAQ